MYSAALLLVAHNRKEVINNELLPNSYPCVNFDVVGRDNRQNKMQNESEISYSQVGKEIVAWNLNFYDYL